MNLSEDAVMAVNDDDDAANMEADAAQDKALEKMKRMKRKESGKKTAECKVPCHQKRMAWNEFFFKPYKTGRFLSRALLWVRWLVCRSIGLSVGLSLFFFFFELFEGR